MVDQKDNISVEKKLGDLMMQGWTMLADACFGCQTPLMKDNVTKQIYCVGCEAWVCTKEKRKTGHKFNELVSLEGKRNIQVKENKDNAKVVVPPRKGSDYNHKATNLFRTILENKLITLSQWLEKETDVTKVNEILDAIKKTIDLLNNSPISSSKDSTQLVK